MFAKVVEDAKVVLEESCGAKITFSVPTKGLSVLFPFLRESSSSLRYFVMVMNALDSLLETHGNEQADDDRGNVNEKVSPGVNSVIGWMHIEHVRCLPEVAAVMLMIATRKVKGLS
jgi:hypothetical protein